MPPIARLYITRWAFALIEREARSYIVHGANVENETGGILIGQRLDEDRVVILAATGPGPRAEMGQFEFSPDIGYANNLLRDYHIAYPGSDYVGTWHKHPLNITSFSRGDLNTARDIIRDRSYKLDELFCPIVWVDGEKFYANCYYLDRGDLRARAPFQLIPDDRIELIDDRHPLIDEVAPNRPALLKLRLFEERDLLVRSGYTARLVHDLEQQTYLMEVLGAGLGERVLIFELPLEYPRRPPTVTIEHPGRKSVNGSEESLRGFWARLALPSLLMLVEQMVNRNGVKPQTARVLPLPSERDGGTGAIVVSRSSERKQRSGASFSWVWLPVTLAIVFLLSAWFLFTNPRGVAGVPTPVPSLPPPTATLSTDQAWERVETTDDLAARVALIEELVRSGVTVDPAGVSTVQRLFDARMELGQDLRDRGNYAGAVAAFQAAASGPPSESSRNEISRQLAATYLEQAETARKLADYNGALVAYEALLSLQPPVPGELRRQASEGQVAARQENARLQEVRQIIAAFNQARSAAPPNWNVAVSQLTTLESILGLRPSPEQYPSGVFGEEITRLPELLLSTRLNYAADHERNGELDQAEVQYVALLEDAELRETLGDAGLAEASARRERLNSARQLWQIVNGNLDRGGDLAPARGALVDLVKLGFDPDSRNPRNFQESIADLQTRVRATPVPPTRTPPPTVTPRIASPATTIAETATATDLGEAPTSEPNPIPVATETPLPPPTPAPAVYEVRVVPISREQMASYFPNGAIPLNVNAFIDGPGELSMSIRTAGGAPIAEFTSDVRVLFLPLNQSAVIQVQSDGRGNVTSVGGGFTSVQDQYYLISVTRIS